MIVRLSKCALLAGVALYFTLIVFNNVTDYGSNYEYVRHVLMMDTTFPGNHGLWRAIWNSGLHTAFYIGIIGWEVITMVLCWWGVAAMAGNVRAPAAQFTSAKAAAIAGLTAGALLFLVAFLAVGGEWFLMWQSRLWDGRDSAFRLFAVQLLVLLYTVVPYGE